MARAADIRSKARATADEIQRDLIADATCEVIAAEGLEAASLRRIADHLDCTTGLLTHYYASKDDLMVRALERATERLTGSSSLVVPTDVTVRQRLDAFYATLPVEGDARTFWLVLLAFRAASIGNPRLAATYDRFGEEALAVLQRAIGAELGRPADDPRVIEVAAGINAVIEGFGASAALDPARFTREVVTRQVETAVAALLESGRRND